jgi:tungstate transport system substrate-binding protein
VSRRTPVAVAVALSAITLVAALAACGSDEGAISVRQDQLVVATTTSLNDSGLLDEVVLPALERVAPDVTVKVIAVGSGEAIAMGAKGEADVLLVHSPADEQQFMDDGYGTLRLPFAYNYFVIVGPASDPAAVGGADSAAAGFAAVAKAGAAFVSRGDESGTHKKELKIWEAAGIEPAGAWYLSAGQGMGETLRIASEKQGYTLTDLGTFLAQRRSLDLEALFTASDDLKNVYDVIIVDQARFGTVNAAAAERLAQVLVSVEGQEAIARFGREEFGQALFNPYAGSLGGY